MSANKMIIIGIDPGSAETAYAVINRQYEIIEADKIGNSEFRARLNNLYPPGTIAVIEGIQSYGMAVGREVFDTCYQVGRILERCEMNNITTAIYNRPEYSKAICGVNKVTDAVLRQALLLRFGGDKKGEPLFALKGNSDKRSAFAIAAYYLDMCRTGEEVT